MIKHEFIKGPRCETYFTTTTPYCTFCQAQAEALVLAIVEAASQQSISADTQQLAYQTSLITQSRLREANALIASQAQQQLQLNNTIQSLLQLAYSKSLSPGQISFIQQAQSFASNATLFVLQASEQAQTTISMAASYVAHQQTLLVDMILAANNSNYLQPVAQSILAKNLLNRTSLSIALTETQEITLAETLAAENSALIASFKTQSQILAIQSLLTQQSYEELMNQTNRIILTILNVTNLLYLSISQANIAHQATVQAQIAQNKAVQKSIAAARLAICYPNPCMHGGMCTVNPNNESFTCFCSSNYQGSK